MHDAPANTNELVDAWLAANGGPRRFSRGDSSDFFSIQGWLIINGYELRAHRGKFKLGRFGESPKTLQWREVLRLVDILRAANGLEPIILEAA